MRRLRFMTQVGLGSLSVPSVACATNDDNCKPKVEDLPECEDPKPKKCKKWKPDEANQTELEKCIAKCRKDFVPVKNAFAEYSEQALTMTKDTTKMVMRNVNYLQNCAPTEVKVGTIIGSGLFGMLLGFRRGLMRKIFYGYLGSVTAATIIYPAQAKMVATQGCILTKQYAILAYKYMNGTAGQCPKKECKKKCKKPEPEKGDCPKEN